MFGVPKAEKNAAPIPYIPWASKETSASFLGSSSLIFLSFSVTTPSASSQEIGSHLGSTPRPFSELVLFNGVRTRRGWYIPKIAEFPFAHIFPEL